MAKRDPQIHLSPNALNNSVWPFISMYLLRTCRRRCDEDHLANETVEINAATVIPQAGMGIDQVGFVFRILLPIES